MTAQVRDARRAALLERCQQERYELVGLRATAVAMAPRARAWLRAARVVLRVARIFLVHPQRRAHGT